MPRTVARPSRAVRVIQLLLVLTVLACSRGPSGPPAIILNNGNIEVTGLPASTLRALGEISESEWPSILRVSVSPDAPGMLGAYAVADGVARFTPAFPLDAGRQYHVTFDASRVDAAADGSPLTAQVGRPAEHTEPTTVVTSIYPTSATVPENVLRMYIEFSAPMGRKSGVEYIHLLDDAGKEIPGAVLPLDYEFWSPDHRRFTVFFDPGRVKDGILPNREMGRAFMPGKTVTLVVDREWRDEHGLPLAQEYRKRYEVLPADTRPLDPVEWKLTPPAASGRTPLVVTFPKPLDHSLLQRALGVRRDGSAVAGDVEIGAGETTWRFTPREPWRAGTYQFLALDVLEDVAGNQVGRAFEVDNFDTVDKDPDPASVTIPFDVR